MAGVVGAALRGFGKALKKAKREIKKTPPLRKGTKALVKGALIGGVVASGVEYKKRKARGDYKAKGGRIGFKRAGPVTKGDLAKRDLWRKRELKRRSQIGQRKSRWDIKGGISGHPLNPLRIHADAKATDWNSMRKDVYNRTRDDLKKSRDPNVKRVAENFQKMDYLDKSRSDSRYQKGTSKWGKDYAPKLTKRVHVGRKTGGKA